MQLRSPGPRQGATTQHKSDSVHGGEEPDPWPPARSAPKTDKRESAKKNKDGTALPRSPVNDAVVVTPRSQSGAPFGLSPQQPCSRGPRGVQRCLQCSLGVASKTQCCKCRNVVPRELGRRLSPV